MVHFTQRAGRRPAALAAAAVVVLIGAAALPAGPQSAAATPAPAGVQHFAIDPVASQVSYRVAETLFANNQFKTAVGVTHGVQGDIYVDRAHPKQSRAGPITVDVSQFTSDSGRRDQAIRQRWLESSRYPQAVFTPTSIEGLPDAYIDGRDVPVQIAGSLKVRDVARPVTFTGTLRLQGDVLTGHATATVLMTDFGFDPPSIIMLRADNRVLLDLQFTARRTSEG